MYTPDVALWVSVVHDVLPFIWKKATYVELFSIKVTGVLSASHAKPRYKPFANGYLVSGLLFGEVNGSPVTVTLPLAPAVFALAKVIDIFTTLPVFV